MSVVTHHVHAGHAALLPARIALHHLSRGGHFGVAHLAVDIGVVHLEGTHGRRIGVGRVRHREFTQRQGATARAAMRW